MITYDISDLEAPNSYQFLPYICIIDCKELNKIYVGLLMPILMPNAYALAQRSGVAISQWKD